MRGLILVLIGLFVFSGLAGALERDATLKTGQSYVIEDKNITLFDANEDSFILCVNGNKYLLNDDKNVDGLFVNVRQKDIGEVKVTFSIDKKDKTCVDCSNEGCIANLNSVSTSTTLQTITTTTILNEATTTTVLNKETTTIVVNEVSESKKDMDKLLKLGVLVLMVILLIIALLLLFYRQRTYKKWKQKQKYY